MIVSRCLAIGLLLSEVQQRRPTTQAEVRVTVATTSVSMETAVAVGRVNPVTCST